MTDTPNLRAIVDRLNLMADQGDYGRKPDPSDVRRQAASAITALQARVVELEEGLEPFAKMGQLIESGWGPKGWQDGDAFQSGGAWRTKSGETDFLRYRDFRKARSLSSREG
jgi:hypothetical protein